MLQTFIPTKQYYPFEISSTLLDSLLNKQKNFHSQMKVAVETKGLTVSKKKKLVYFIQEQNLIFCKYLRICNSLECTKKQKEFAIKKLIALPSMINLLKKVKAM